MKRYQFGEVRYGDRPRATSLPLHGFVGIYLLGALLLAAGCAACAGHWASALARLDIVPGDERTSELVLGAVVLGAAVIAYLLLGPYQQARIFNLCLARTPTFPARASSPRSGSGPDMRLQLKNRRTPPPMIPSEPGAVAACTGPSRRSAPTTTTATAWSIWRWTAMAASTVSWPGPTVPRAPWATAPPISSASTCHGEAMLNAPITSTARSARLHLAPLRIEDGEIALGGEVGKTYRAAETRLAEPFAHAPAVLYFADGARCEIPGPRPDRLLEELLGYRRSAVVRWQDNIRSALLLALALLVALLAWSVGWVIPALGERIAGRGARPSVDQAFGERALLARSRRRAAGGGVHIRTPSTLRSAAPAGSPDTAPARDRAPRMRVLRACARLGLHRPARCDSPARRDDRHDRPAGLVDTSATPSPRTMVSARHWPACWRTKSRMCGCAKTMREVASSSLTAALSSALLGDFSGASGMPGRHWRT